MFKSHQYVLILKLQVLFGHSRYRHKTAENNQHQENLHPDKIMIIFSS